MKFKTGIALILSATTIGIETRLITTSAAADAQEEKTPTHALNSVTQRTVTVYPTDFLTYFQRNGSAANFNYDTQNFVQTLTPNTKDQSGNVTLKTKVDMSQNFTLSGSINLGNKSSRTGGADVVGFLFHPGNTDVVGVKGGAAGIGGVQGAFGFKLDTYYNYDGDPYFYPDPSEFSPSQAYGAFVDGTSGVAQTLEEGAQPISQPSNNQFKSLKMSYDGTSKIMTVAYDGKIWQQDVSDLIGTNQSMAFSISASTGDNFNLQQLQLSNFQYTIAQGTVHANYLDENGQSLKATITTSGDIDTLYTTNQATISGYTFERVTGAAHIGTYQANVQDVNYIYKRNQGFATITYIDDTTGQVLTQKEITGATGETTNYTTKTDIATFLSKGYQYVSDNFPKVGVVLSDQHQNFEVHLTHQSIKTTENKQVKEVVHYQYENGKQALNDYLAIPLKFTRTITTDQATGGKTYGNWLAAKETTFNKVISPTLKGLTPDASQIAAIDKVTGDTADIDKTVVYRANHEEASVDYLDDTTHQTLTVKDLSGDFGASDAYRTAEMIQHYRAQGYDLVSDSYPTSGVVYDEDGVVKHYHVHLAHQTNAKSEPKIVNETVHYQYQNGSQAADDYTASPLRFTRTVISDRVTGNQIKGSWTPVGETTFGTVTSPSIQGDTPDQSQIDAVLFVSGDSTDIVKTVIYAANPEKARVTYLDDTRDKILSSQELTGDFGTRDNYKTDETIKKYQGQGYALVSDTYPKTGVIYDEDGRVKYYEVHLSHDTVKSIETKTVNEVVHYVYQNGDKAVTDFVAIPLEFTRTVATDQATGDKTDGDWIASSGTSFDKVISPSLKNYTPDEPQVAAIDKVSGETKDIVKTIVYTKVPRPVKMPTDKDKVVPHYPSQPSESGHKTQTPSVPVIAQASKKELPDTGAKSGISETIFGVIIFFATAKWLKFRKNQE